MFIDLLSNYVGYLFNNVLKGGNKMKTLVLLFAAYFVFITPSFAQTEWTKYENNPVLDFGQFGSWDWVAAAYGSVLFDDGTYHMWYSGFDGLTYRIGQATSPDGIDWLKDSLNNPVLDVGLPGSWDDIYVYAPCVILVDSTFHMWYDGNDGSKERIGHATSPDGVKWTKDTLNNPVLNVGPPGSWDDTEVFNGLKSILFDGSIYHMWYGGGDASSNYSIGYAKSPDGINWDKDTSNPVMEPGLPGTWDGNDVIPGTIIFDGSIYHSWYSGYDGAKWCIGYATSPDGINWDKDTSNPVLCVGPSGSWDEAHAWEGSVLIDTVYKMWYSGGSFYSGRIGYAIDTTLISVVTMPKNIPEQFVLSQNYPNPFNPTTTIKYQIPEMSFVTLKIYDVLGSEVATLVNEEKAMGSYEVKWHANNSPSGVYFYRIQAGDYFETKKMLMLK